MASVTVIVVMAVVMTMADAVKMRAMAVIVAVGVLVHRPLLYALRRRCVVVEWAYYAV